MIGTWTAPQETTENEFGIVPRQSKQMIDVTFTADHKYLWALHGRSPIVTGRWRLDGWWLVTEIKRQPKGGKLGREYRDKIVGISDRELIFPESKLIQGDDGFI